MLTQHAPQHAPEYIPAASRARAAADVRPLREIGAKHIPSYRRPNERRTPPRGRHTDALCTDSCVRKLGAHRNDGERGSNADTSGNERAPRCLHVFFCSRPGPALLPAGARIGRRMLTLRPCAQTLLRQPGARNLAPLGRAACTQNAPATTVRNETTRSCTFSGLSCLHPQGSDSTGGRYVEFSRCVPQFLYASSSSRPEPEML